MDESEETDHESVRMTRTLSASLGFSPLPVKQGIDQTSRFMAQLRSLQKKPDGVSLLTVTHAQPPHMEVIAMYDADNADAAAWVKQPRRSAPSCGRRWASGGRVRRGNKAVCSDVFRH